MRKRPTQNQWRKLNHGPKIIYKQTSRNPPGKLQLYRSYKKTMDTHASIRTRAEKREYNTWFNKDSRKLKIQWRTAEKRWIKSKQHDLVEYKQINSVYEKHLYHPKTHIIHSMTTKINLGTCTNTKISKKNQRMITQCHQLNLHWTYLTNLQISS